MPNQYKYGNLYYVRQRRAKVYEIINKIKNVPCTDCGIKYPSYVMDLDHVRGTKFKNVSQLTTYSTEKVLEELKKCEVVCANCHRIRTHNHSGVV